MENWKNKILPRFESKILSQSQCISIAKNIPRPLVFTNGVFDILHLGHVTYLDMAAQLGASLLVAVNTDNSAQSLEKGLCPRPINNLKDRVTLIAALSSVTYVTNFLEKTPEALINKMKPDFLVKGGDYNLDNIPEKSIMDSWGGKVLIIPIQFERSTSSIIKKIQNLGKIFTL